MKIFERVVEKVVIRQDPATGPIAPLDKFATEQRTLSRSPFTMSRLKLKSAGSIEETELHIGFRGGWPKGVLLTLLWWRARVR